MALVKLIWIVMVLVLIGPIVFFAFILPIGGMIAGWIITIVNLFRTPTYRRRVNVPNEPPFI